MWFDSTYDLWKIILVGISSYVSLIVLLRISGKRVLSKLNAFDFVVTIALGSVLASILTSQQVTFTEGLTAFAVLIALQLSITWISVRIPFFRTVITSSPTVVFKNGQFLEEKMKKQRLTKSEIFFAMRKSGIGSTDQVEAVVLETDGTLSVIPEIPDERNSTLRTIYQKEMRE